MPRVVSPLLALSLWLVAVPASAAPVAVSATLGIWIEGLAPLTVGGAGVIDVSGSTLTVPAGLVALGGTIVIPVTGLTAIDSLSVTKLSNLSGIFSAGGVTAQVGSEVCPGGGPAAGRACNVGGVGVVGGVMGLTGTLFVNVIPNIVVIPLNLNTALIGQGGSGSSPFPIDGAAWSTGLGLVNTGVNVVGMSAISSSGGFGVFQLVTPTFVNVLGNVLPTFTTLIFGGGGPPLPEPGALLLIAMSAAGLAWLRR